MSGEWSKGKFLIAMPHGPDERRGFVWRGLGLYVAVEGSPKERRPPKWSLTHLGSGHSVCMIEAPRDKAFAIATEIAEAGDWSFEGLKGYQNQFPDAADRMREIMARHAVVSRTGGASHEGVARAVAMASA